MTSSGRQLALGSGVMFYAQLVQLVVQLVSIPVLVTCWGLSGFGTWQLLIALPALLAVSDFGLIAASGNVMTDAVAKGDRKQANELYTVLRYALGLIALALVAAGAILVPPSWPLVSGSLTIPGGHGVQTAMMLIAFAACALLTSLAMAGHRATDGFIVSTAVFVTLILVENGAGIAAALLGGGLRDTAAAMLICRIVGTGVLAWTLRSRSPWLVRRRRPNWNALRQIFPAAMATLPLPAAQAVAIQGALATIGATAGVAAIPAFVAARTLTRTALQFAVAVNLASMPQFTVAAARGDVTQCDKLTLINLVVFVGLLVPAAIGLLLYGQVIVHIWSGGRVSVPFALLIVLVVSMLAHAAWLPVGNLILAINRHAGYTYWYLGVAIAGFLLGWLAALRFGAVGAAGGVLLIELAMVAKVWPLAHRLDILVPNRLLSIAGSRRW